MADLQQIADHIAYFAPTERNNGAKVVTVTMSVEVRDCIVSALRAAPVSDAAVSGSRGWPKTADIVLPRDLDGRSADPVAHILGLAAMPWILSDLAHLLRDGGDLPIPRKAEAEMAAALHWMIGIAIAHGDTWNVVFEREIERLANVRATAKSSNGEPEDPHHG